MRIGLTQRVEVVSSYGERRDCLDQEWIKLFEILGFVPVPLSNAMVDVKSYLDSLGLSGVILTGGNDLASVPAATNAAPERDTFEKKLINICTHANIPLLGVCRGMQMLASYYGSKLNRIKGHVRSRHNVSFDMKHTLLKKIQVNSFHEYSINKSNLGSNLIALAYSDDDCVEMIKHKDFNQYGIMWHPERERLFTDFDKEFLSSIFNQTDIMSNNKWSKR